MAQALGNVISSGSHEYSEFSANFSAWKNDQRAVQEPAFGPLLTQVCAHLPISYLPSVNVTANDNRMPVRHISGLPSQSNIVGEGGSDYERWERKSQAACLADCLNQIEVIIDLTMCDFRHAGQA